MRKLLCFASALVAAPAHACVACHSAGGCALRHALFSATFPHNLLMVAAPVPAFAVALLALQFAVPAERP